MWTVVDWWVCAKRLERGRSAGPPGKATHSITMRPEELAMLVNGMDLAQARPRKNWMGRTPSRKRIV